MRYIILKDKKLKWYKSLSLEDMKTPQGVINFDNFCCMYNNIAHVEYSLKVIHPFLPKMMQTEKNILLSSNLSNWKAAYFERKEDKFGFQVLFI